MASVFSLLRGSRNAWRKSEGIGVQDGKYIIHHGDPKACRWGGHHIFHHGRTIGEQSFGKMAWSDEKRDLPSSV